MSAVTTGAGGGWLWVVCAAGACRHAEPFHEIAEADDFACADHEGCGGTPHSIVAEPGGLGIATSEPVPAVPERTTKPEGQTVAMEITYTPRPGHRPYGESGGW